MLGGEGYYRGCSDAASAARPARARPASPRTSRTRPAARGERCLYFAFEESPGQIVRNMRSIGIDLEPYRRNGTAAAPRVAADAARARDASRARCTSSSCEFDPSAVIVDPISNFIVGRHRPREVQAMLLRLIDFLKSRQITALFTHLTSGGDAWRRRTWGSRR